MTFLWVTVGIILGGFTTISSAGNLNARLVGGSNAGSSQRYPYMASIVHKTQKLKAICGAAIVGKQLLLTAAHCVIKYRNNNLYIVAGAIDFRDKKLVKRGIESVVIHEEYSQEIPMGFDKPVALANDIAVIKVTEMFKFNNNIKPVKLPNQEVELNTQCITVGRGISDYKAVNDSVYLPWRKPYRTQHPMKLQVAKLTINDPFTCLRISHLFQNQLMLCAGNPFGYGPSICAGDFGSPLVCNGALHGIAAYAIDEQCSSRILAPGFFTKVGAYIEWLKDHGVEIDDSDNYDY